MQSIIIRDESAIIVSGKKDFKTKKKCTQDKGKYLQSKICISICAAAAKSLQACPTLCDPTEGSPPGSPVKGFSRQERWSGLPFPSPMHESEK